MKLVFSTIFFMYSLRAFAIPVVNENVANSGVITIYPDHADPNRFYIAPNVVMVGENESGKLMLSYQDVSKGSITYTEAGRTITKYLDIKGYLHFILVPAYTRSELESAKQQILSKNPNAEFSGVPFIRSELNLTGSLKGVFTTSSCSHVAGLIAQEQNCDLELTKVGRRAFLQALEKKTIFLTLDFEYQFQAVVRLADGSFQDQVVHHGVAARIDGSQISQYPELVQIIN